MNDSCVIVPSLPAKDFSELKSLTHSLAGTSNELQIDIVDGHFVSRMSWPFTADDPIKELERLKELPAEFQLEFDCMVMHPEQYLDQLVALGAWRIIVHMGSTAAFTQIFEHARAHEYKLGLAFTNDVPLPSILPRLRDVDFVQVMGIKEVGQQGQPFDERTLQTVRTLRSVDADLEIAVDGSVNKDTVVALREAGVNRFCPGSAVAKAENPKIAFLELQTLLTNEQP